MRAHKALPLLLTACAGDIVPETVLDELTVLAIAPTPPEVGPDAAIELEVTVVDPDDAAFDVLVWLCTDTGEGCAEAGDATPRDLDTFAVVLRDAREVSSVRFAAVPGLGLALPDEDAALPIFAWALACRPGACDVIDEVAAAPAPGSAEWSAVVQRLADPRSVLDGVRIVDGNLATHGVWVSRSASPNQAPALRVTEPDEAPAVTEEAPYVVSATEDVELFAYAVRGSWDTAQASIFANLSGPTLDYRAPESAGPDRVYLVAEDLEGGTTVWSSTVLVSD